MKNTTDSLRAVACIRFVRPWLWLVAVHGLGIDVDESLTEDSDDGGVISARHLVRVLVTVNEKWWPGPVNVADKALETLMRLGVSLVNSSRGVVGHKHVNRWHTTNQTGYLDLVKKMVPTGFITPTASEASESKSAKAVSPHMQVNDAIAEWGVWIMVTPDCQSELGSIVVDGSLDGGIVKIATGDENVNIGAIEPANRGLLIRYDNNLHGFTGEAAFLAERLS